MVDVDAAIDVAALTPGARVALRSDAYTLHLVLPSKVDPLVSLMKVEKVRGVRCGGGGGVGGGGGCGGWVEVVWGLERGAMGALFAVSERGAF